MYFFSTSLSLNETKLLFYDIIDWVFFQEYHQSVKHFNPDQVGCFVRPDLGQKCLLDDTSRVRVYEDNPNKLGSRLVRESWFHIKLKDNKLGEYTYS